MIVLLIPVAAVLLALVWTRWSRQPDKPLDPMAQVEEHHRVVDALAPRSGIRPVTRERREPARTR